LAVAEVTSRLPFRTVQGTAESGQNSGRNGVEAKSEQGTNANKFALAWQILSIKLSPSSGSLLFHIREHVRSK
jgi:methionine-rich copper-binding protein CopC